MRASGAHHRRTSGNVLGEGFSGFERDSKLLGNLVGHELVDVPEQLLAPDFYAYAVAMGLYYAVKLLDDDHRINGGREVSDELYRKRIDQTQLQHRVFVCANFLHIVVACGGGDDSDLSVRTFLDSVDRGGFGPFGQIRGPLFHDRVALFRHARHHDVLCDVLLIGLDRDILPGRKLHDALAVGDACAHLHQDRRVELLGKLVGQLGESQGLGGIRRLQHGQLGRNCVVSGILLVL